MVVKVKEREEGDVTVFVFTQVVLAKVDCFASGTRSFQHQEVYLRKEYIVEALLSLIYRIN